ncbi:hypothetical protein VTL71DRAFT_8706 [Oculimacula yallundae]|uniref:Uncharacterized protein n=1 Tax=Oculimacula yallundae TaxID=86028 RepID=A0ABR4D0L4_9HELO
MSASPDTVSRSVLALQDELHQSPWTIEELEAVRATLDQEIEARNFAKKYAELVEDVRLLTAKNENLEKESTELRTRIAELEDLEAKAEKERQGKERTCDCQIEMQQLETEVLGLKEKLVTKSKAIDKLEEDLAFKEPLFQVGVSVRLGCLEKAKELRWEDYSADVAIMEKRNIAAHEGDWKADAALCRLGHISLQSFKYSGCKSLWNELYGFPPTFLTRNSSRLTAYTFPDFYIKAVNMIFTVVCANMPKDHSSDEFPVTEIKKLAISLLELRGIGPNAVVPLEKDVEVQEIMSEMQTLRDSAVRYLLHSSWLKKAALQALAPHSPLESSPSRLSPAKTPTLFLPSSSQSFHNNVETHLDSPKIAAITRMDSLRSSPEPDGSPTRAAAEHHTPASATARNANLDPHQASHPSAIEEARVSIAMAHASQEAALKNWSLRLDLTAAREESIVLRRDLAASQEDTESGETEIGEDDEEEQVHIRLEERPNQGAISEVVLVDRNEVHPAIPIVVQDELHPDVAFVPNHNAAVNEHFEAEIANLKAQLVEKDGAIARLEKERGLKEPLFQVGVNDRLGCLEHAKEVFMEGYAAEGSIMFKRNAAVNEGNWKADTSLYFLKAVTLGSGLRAKVIPYDVWNKLYGILPVNLASASGIPTNVIKLMNYAFAINAAELPDSVRHVARKMKAQSYVNEALDHWAMCVVEDPGVLNDPFIDRYFMEGDEPDVLDDDEDWNLTMMVQRLEAIMTDALLEFRGREGRRVI